MAKKRQRVTLEDVAREAGVSSMTVSRVINNTGRIGSETRARVREVINRLDYRPSRAARALVTSRTYLIGVVVPDITNPYFAEIVQGVEHVAWEHDFSVLLTNTDENPRREEAVLSQLDESTVDGLIVVSSRLPDATLLPLLERHPALVTVNRDVPHQLASMVRNLHGMDHRPVVAIQHLIEGGRQRIGCLALKRSAIQISRERYIALLTAAGLEVSPDWYRLCPPNFEGGLAVMRELLAQCPELDSIVAGNDRVALGVLRAATEAGRRVPADLAIVGGDDTLLASQVTPALSTFNVPKFEIGAMAARLLLRQIGGDSEYHEYLYDETLIVRDSSP
jgi:LacI family transcriptional regulator